MHYQNFNPKISGWAKTDEKGRPGLSIFSHCCNVGWIACELLNKYVMPHSKIDIKDAVFLSAIHDVGKWSPGFLHMCPAWLEEEGLTLLAEQEAWSAQKGIRHEKFTQDSFQLFLQCYGFKQSESYAWAMVPGAHHGRMHRSEIKKKDLKYLLEDSWHVQRIQFFEVLESKFPNELTPAGLEKKDPIVPWLMGLTSVADWIGSDELYFPAETDLNEKEGKNSAKQAVKSIGLGVPEIKKNLRFEDIFPFEANDMQQKAISKIQRPGVYVIEAPMGLGKTEAALWCSYELLQSGQASGLYFTLPTQLTSNRIHHRVSDFIKKITDASENTRLAHANAWLEKDYYQPRTVHSTNNKKEDANVCRDWFASSKRGLLANFGVGTVDQALMAVVAVKHFFVRRFALAGKVIIIDEVHSYDHFTGTLVNCLCDELAKLGCTIIILSATLLPEVRNKLIDNDENSIQNEGYPLISGKTNSNTLISPQASKPKSLPFVKRIFKSEEQCLKDALVAARRGSRVLWVCNTVNKAQSIFSKLQDSEGDFDLGILHSRYPHYIRQNWEDYWMERLGKEEQSTRGCILVSTQIVEQSVDIDADVLISELAPIDMLLQRMGRLWRHLENRTPSMRKVENPEIWILEEEKTLIEMRGADSDQLKEILGVKTKVYLPYVLLKTYETLHEFNLINLADENGKSDIRELLRKTYVNDKNDPESWKNLFNEMKGTGYAEKELALSNTRLFSKMALDEEEGKQTRLNEIPTLSLIIASNIGKDTITLLNGDEIDREPEKFNIQHARSIHKNIIRVHAWPHENPETYPAITFYVKGDYTLAVMDEDNCLKVKGLKAGVSLSWDETIGVEQYFKKGGADESCD